MPFIQCDFQDTLTDKQKEALSAKIVEVVNKSIGSSIPHINVVIREWPGRNMVEAGQPSRDFAAK